VREGEGRAITISEIYILFTPKKPYSFSPLRGCLIQPKGGKGRDFNRGEGREREGREIF
jgi:hypothetical protein